MANKRKTCIDVTLIEKEALVRLLSAEVTRLQDVLELTADADEWEDISEQIFSLNQLTAQINLAWRRDAPYPTRKMKRKWYEGL